MSAGEVDTGGLVVMVNMLSRYLRTYPPTHLAVCWDGGRSRYRTKVFADYKAARKPRSDTDDTPRLAREFLALANVPAVVVDGVEADDLVAAYWRAWYDPSRADDHEFVILSGDKDFLQLVDDDRCFLVRPGAKPEVWGSHTVFDHYGCGPEQLPYVFALAGDASDGISGVPRIGPKTAVKLLGLVDWVWQDVLEHERIAPSREVAEMCLDLVGLRRQRFDLDVGVVPEFHPSPLTDSLVEFCDRYELANLRSKLADGTLWEAA